MKPHCFRKWKQNVCICAECADGRSAKANQNSMKMAEEEVKAE